mmetsp:Transcript_73036/g.123078  ORF Transcript_73036/g.123078 Transcript_73036/m.123078 type:complete len:124 (+) Transcript_73036:1164-1535(+)
MFLEIFPATLAGDAYQKKWLPYFFSFPAVSHIFFPPGFLLGVLRCGQQYFYIFFFSFVHGHAGENRFFSMGYGLWQQWLVFWGVFWCFGSLLFSVICSSGTQFGLWLYQTPQTGGGPNLGKLP